MEQGYIAKMATAKMGIVWWDAGNIVEAVLGVAWIHTHHHAAGNLDALVVSDAHQDSVGDHGSLFSNTLGSK